MDEPDVYSYALVMGAPGAWLFTWQKPPVELSVRLQQVGLGGPSGFSGLPETGVGTSHQHPIGLKMFERPYKMGAAKGHATVRSRSYTFAARGGHERWGDEILESADR